MPDPERVVGRTVRQLQRRGYSEYEAFNAVYDAADHAHFRVCFCTPVHICWIGKVRNYALMYLARRMGLETTHVRGRHERQQ